MRPLHASNVHSLKVSELASMLSKASGRDIDLMPYWQWRALLESSDACPPDMPLFPFRSYFNVFPGWSGGYGHDNTDAAVGVACVEGEEALGLCPKPTQAMIDAMVKAFVEA